MGQKTEQILDELKRTKSGRWLMALRMSLEKGVSNAVSRKPYMSRFWFIRHMSEILPEGTERVHQYKLRGIEDEDLEVPGVWIDHLPILIKRWEKDNLPAAVVPEVVGPVSVPNGAPVTSTAWPFFQQQEAPVAQTLAVPSLDTVKSILQYHCLGTEMKVAELADLLFLIVKYPDAVKSANAALQDLQQHKMQTSTEELLLYLDNVE